MDSTILTLLQLKQKLKRQQEVDGGDGYALPSGIYLLPWPDAVQWRQVQKLCFGRLRQAGDQQKKSTHIIGKNTDLLAAENALCTPSLLDGMLQASPTDNAIEAGSLASQKKKMEIVELILESAPSTSLQRELKRLLKRLPSSLFMLISYPKGRSKVKLKKLPTWCPPEGNLITLDPITTPHRYQKWLEACLADSELKLDRQATQQLSSSLHGDLPSGWQSMQFLQFVARHQELAMEKKAQNVAMLAHGDAANGSIFATIDQIVAGNLNGLREKIDALLIHRESALHLQNNLINRLRQLATMAKKRKRGRSSEEAAQLAGLWASQAAISQRAIKRLGGLGIRQMLNALAVADSTHKGAGPDPGFDSNLSLRNIVWRLALGERFDWPEADSKRRA